MIAFTILPQKLHLLFPTQSELRILKCKIKRDRTADGNVSVNIPTVNVQHHCLLQLVFDIRKWNIHHKNKDIGDKPHTHKSTCLQFCTHFLFILELIQIYLYTFMSFWSSGLVIKCRKRPTAQAQDKESISGQLGQCHILQRFYKVYACKDVYSCNGFKKSLFCLLILCV